MTDSTAVVAVEAAPLPDAVPAEPPRVLTTRAEFDDAVARLAAGHGPVAVDAERASGFRYSQRAYLIQLHRRGTGTVLLDPPAIGDFSALQAAIGGEEWILHAASQDLPCLREVGLKPARLFDTELGARLLGLERVGLGAVIEQLLGLHLAKEHSAADWSTRPLPASWLVYAALDVELLVDARDRMRDLLVEAGKTAIAEQEFDAVLHRRLPAPRVDPWRRLSGLHVVRGSRNLAVARELWLARDEYARSVDQAPGRLVPDASLVAVARTPPTTKRELAAMRTFSGRASRTEIDRWWQAVETGRSTEQLPPAHLHSDAPPPPRAWPDRNPEADRRLRAARVALSDIAEGLHMPSENLLTPDTVRRVAWHPPEPLTEQGLTDLLRTLDARPWQIEATAGPLVASFVQAAVPEEPTPDPPQDDDL